LRTAVAKKMHAARAPGPDGGHRLSGLPPER
jgi:hypothetical protein